MPHRLARALRGLVDRDAQVVVVGHDPGGPVAECDGLRARERGSVDDEVGLLLRRGDEGIGEDEASLGVGVEDLHRAPAVDRDDIAGTLCAAPGHVLHRGDPPDDLHLEFQLCDRRHRGDDRSGTTHVALHRLHGLRRLERQTAGVEGHALADDRDRALRALGGVLHADEARRIRRALSDREDAAEFIARQGLLVPHLDTHGQFAHGLERLLGNLLGGKRRRGSVDEIARVVDGLGDDLGACKRSGLLLVLGVARDEDPLHGGGLAGSTRTTEGVEGVVAEQCALSDGFYSRPVGCRHDDPDRCAAREAPQCCAGRAADLLVVEDARVAEANRHDHAGLNEAGAWDTSDLAQLARGAQRLEGLLEGGAHVGGQCRGAFEALLAIGGDADDEGVDVEGGHGGGGEGDARHGRRP